jgi:hypothetical protein
MGAFGIGLTLQTGAAIELLFIKTGISAARHSELR